MNGVGGSDVWSTCSDTKDGTRAPYAASMSLNDSDTADCSDRLLKTESVGERSYVSVGESGDMGDVGEMGKRGRGGTTSSGKSAGSRRAKRS